MCLSSWNFVPEVNRRWRDHETAPEGAKPGVRFATFGGNESSLALFARSSLVHRFDVKQVVLIWLQENLLLAAPDA